MKRFETTQRYYFSFPTREAHFAQLGPGSHCPSATMAFGRNLVLIRMRTEPLATSTLVTEPDWYLFQIPLFYEGKLIVNGWIHSDSDFYLMRGGKEWVTTARNRKFLLIGIRKQAFDQACAALLGREPECLTSENLLIRSGAALNNRLKALGNYVMNMSAPLCKDKDNLCIPATVEAIALDELACSFNQALERGRIERIDRRSSYQTIVNAVGYFRDAGVSAVSIADLCAVTGVSRTRLHQCFIEVYGVSAGKYLRQLRLSTARDALSYPGSAPDRIKQVAIDAGFQTSGRFAAAYHRAFGELPSATLRRARLEGGCI